MRSIEWYNSYLKSLPREQLVELKYHFNKGHANYREKNREKLRDKATTYREKNQEKINKRQNAIRREARQDETVDEREVRLAKRRAYRKAKQA